jgi:HlyD family secretion protein
MKHKAWFYGGAAAVALAAALVWAFAPRPVEVELAAVTQGLFEATIDEDGKTRLAERYVVSAPLAGRLARITLKEGDAVGVDTPLAVLSSVLPVMLDERTRRELTARLEAAQDNVARAQARAARAQVLLDQANNEARHSEQLVQQGFIAPIKVEADRLATLGARREVESAAAERRMAAHELEQTQAALSGAKPSEAQVRVGTSNNVIGFTVRAPSSGRVLRVLQTSEGTVALGTPLVEVGDTQRMEVVTELLTTDALAAKVGSRVIIERWGGPVALEGRVRSVEPAAFTKVSALGVEEQRVRVLIALTSPQTEWHSLGDGYRVGVRIVTLSEAQAVQVPVSAVFPLPLAVSAPTDGSGQAASRINAATRYAVFIADQGRARRTEVVLGARNGSAAWILNGLKPAQKVIVYPPAAVRDGLRVAARTP